MSFYRTCPHCGAHLDPGEKCDCIEAKKEQIKESLMKMTEQEVQLLLSAMELSDETGQPLQACVDCLKRAAQGATNTPDGKAEQDLQAPVSASIVNENHG